MGSALGPAFRCVQGRLDRLELPIDVDIDLGKCFEIAIIPDIAFGVLGSPIVHDRVAFKQQLGHAAV